MTRFALLFAGAALVMGCQPAKPAHYYVLCEGSDGRGWTLTNVEKDAQGFIMACTYTSPDKRQWETLRCRETGCD